MRRNESLLDKGGIEKLIEINRNILYFVSSYIKRLLTKLYELLNKVDVINTPNIGRGAQLTSYGYFWFRDEKPLCGLVIFGLNFAISHKHHVFLGELRIELNLENGPFDPSESTSSRS